MIYADFARVLLLRPSRGELFRGQLYLWFINNILDNWVWIRWGGVDPGLMDLLVKQAPRTISHSFNRLMPRQISTLGGNSIIVPLLTIKLHSFFLFFFFLYTTRPIGAPNAPPTLNPRKRRKASRFCVYRDSFLIYLILFRPNRSVKTPKYWN
jgi:hypothetical protein